MAIALLTECAERGIHTAVDTCGYVASDVLLATARLVDLFLYDIKLVNERRHREFTGTSSKSILENARILDRLGCRLWIRLPLISGINDDIQNLLDTARFVSSLRSVEVMQILPYHRGGERKRQQLGMDCSIQARAQTASKVEMAAAILRDHLEIPLTIGG